MNSTVEKMNNTVEKSDLKRYLTLREVAEILSVSKMTAYRWCKNGTLKAFRIKTLWRVKEEDLLDFINENSFDVKR